MAKEKDPEVQTQTPKGQSDENLAGQSNSEETELSKLQKEHEELQKLHGRQTQELGQLRAEKEQREKETHEKQEAEGAQKEKTFWDSFSQEGATEENIKKFKEVVEAREKKIYARMDKQEGEKVASEMRQKHPELNDENFEMKVVGYLRSHGLGGTPESIEHAIDMVKYGSWKGMKDNLKKTILQEIEEKKKEAPETGGTPSSPGKTPEEPEELKQMHGARREKLW